MKFFVAGAALAVEATPKNVDECNEVDGERDTAEVHGRWDELEGC